VYPNGSLVSEDFTPKRHCHGHVFPRNVPGLFVREMWPWQCDLASWLPLKQTLDATSTLGHVLHSIRQHTSAYVIAYVSIRYGIRQHTSACYKQAHDSSSTFGHVLAYSFRAQAIYKPSLQNASTSTSLCHGPLTYPNPRTPCTSTVTSARRREKKREEKPRQCYGYESS
jgi:hypothetical protein